MDIIHWYEHLTQVFVIEPVIWFCVMAQGDLGPWHTCKCSCVCFQLVGFRCWAVLIPSLSCNMVSDAYICKQKKITCSAVLLSPCINWALISGQNFIIGRQYSLYWQKNFCQTYVPSLGWSLYAETNNLHMTLIRIRVIHLLISL